MEPQYSSRRQVALCVILVGLLLPIGGCSRDSSSTPSPDKTVDAGAADAEFTAQGCSVSITAGGLMISQPARPEKEDRRYGLSLRDYVGALFILINDGPKTFRSDLSADLRWFNSKGEAVPGVIPPDEARDSRVRIRPGKWASRWVFFPLGGDRPPKEDAKLMFAYTPEDAESATTYVIWSLPEP